MNDELKSQISSLLTDATDEENVTKSSHGGSAVMEAQR